MAPPGSPDFFTRHALSLRSALCLQCPIAVAMTNALSPLAFSCDRHAFPLDGIYAARSAATSVGFCFARHCSIGLGPPVPVRGCPAKALRWWPLGRWRFMAMAPSLDSSALQVWPTVSDLEKAGAKTLFAPEQSPFDVAREAIS